MATEFRQNCTLHGLGRAQPARGAPVNLHRKFLQITANRQCPANAPREAPTEVAQPTMGCSPNAPSPACREPRRAARRGGRMGEENWADYVRRSRRQGLPATESDPLDANEDFVVGQRSSLWLKSSSGACFGRSAKPGVALCRATMAPQLAPTEPKLGRVGLVTFMHSKRPPARSDRLPSRHLAVPGHGTAHPGPTLTLAVLIPLSGWLTRRLGNRVVFLTAIALFTGASAAPPAGRSASWSHSACCRARGPNPAPNLTRGRSPVHSGTRQAPEARHRAPDHKEGTR